MAGTTICRILLGEELARLRDEADLTRTQVAGRIHKSLSHVGYIETGRHPPTDLDELRQLAALYHANPDELAAMERLWADAKKDTWFSRFGLTEAAARFVGLETDAAVVRSWESENVPGLLQTEEYLRARYRLEPHSGPDRKMNKQIITRLHRQRRLAARDDPLTLIAVISQSALDRCAHGGTVGHGQLAQLHERAAWPNVELRVLATEAGLHPGQDGPFSLLSFPDQLLPDIAYEEFITGGHLTRTPSVVATLHTLFEELRDQSLGPNESIAMIARLLE